MATIIHTLVLSLALTSAPQDEQAPSAMAILRPLLKEADQQFLEVMLSYEREGRTKDLEKHLQANATAAETIFHRVELLHAENAGGFESIWLARMRMLAHWLDQFSKSTQWQKRIDFVASLANPEDRAARKAALGDLFAAQALHEQILADWPDLDKMPECQATLERAQAVFERIHDQQNLAQVHLLYARNAFVEKDHEKLVSELQIARTMWREAGLSGSDAGNLWMIDREQELRKQAQSGANDKAPAAPPKEDWTIAEMQLRKDPKVGSLATLSLIDDDPRNWPSFVIGGDQTSPFPATFKPFGRELRLIREKDRYLLDVNGDRKTAEQLAFKPGKAIMTSVRAGAKEVSASPYQLSIALADKETLFGVTVANAPTKDRALVRYRTACRLEGDVQGQKWFVIDDNDSGQFGDLIMRSDDYVGVDQPFLMPDALFLPGAERAVPFSELLLVQGTLTRLTIDAASSALKWQSAAAGMGKIAIDWVGPVKPRSLVVVGLDDRKQCAYDLMATPEVTAVTGRYRIAYGVLAQGRGAKEQRALILPGKSVPFEVKDGTTTTLKLGAPFTFAFDTQTQADAAVLVGTSLHVQGRGGESYSRFTEVLLPQVTAKSESGKVLEPPRTMDAPTPVEWSKSARAVAFPKDVRVKRDGKEAVRFLLEMPRHPLLGGPITSESK